MTPKKKKALRLLIYVSGLFIQAAGITLNTKITLGVAPIASIAYCISEIWGLTFANVTFVIYCVFIFIQMALHLIRRPPDLKKKLIKDALQFIVNLISTRFLAFFGIIIPVFETVYPNSFLGSISGRLLLLAVAIVLTGIGVATSLFTRVVPGPPDGIVQGISDFTGVSTGLTKNLFDFSCFVITVVISLLFAHKLIGIGIGTLATMLLVGRVVAVCDRLFGEKIHSLTV